MHKKHKKKFLNILLIPDDDSSARTIRIRYWLLRFFLVLVIFFALATLTAFGLYGKLLQLALERNELQQENLQLRQQLTKVHQIMGQLESLKAYEQKLRHALEGYVNVNQQVKLSDNQDVLPEFKTEWSSIFNSIPLVAPVTGFISQEYRPPVHLGIDIVAAEGTPIRAPANGIVLFSGWTYNDGNVIILKHSNGFYTYYKHNLTNLVFAHQTVRQGDVIALLGTSGQSSGPHLHFEIWKNGYPINPLSLVVNLK